MTNSDRRDMRCQEDYVVGMFREFEHVRTAIAC